jgi:hypothetical protein
MIANNEFERCKMLSCVCCPGICLEKMRKIMKGLEVGGVLGKILIGNLPGAT